jgi:hypothetical protein
MQSYANVAVASGLAAVNANVATLTTSTTAANTAMKSYVDSQITSIVGGAPTVLNTLGEIATALNNDANVAATLTNSIAAVNGNVSNLTTNVSSINSDVSNLTTNVSSIAGDVSNLTTNVSSITGDITTINNTLANITVPNLQSVTTDIIPATDIAYDIGSSTNRFRDIYLSTNTIYLGTNAVGIDDSGQLVISESYQGGEGAGDIASVEWITSGNLEIRTSDTSPFVAKFDSLKNGDTFELLTGSDGTFPADTVVTVNGTVTKTLNGSGDYYDFVIPVDIASQSNVYVYNFTLTKSPLTDVSQLSDTGSLLLSNSISNTDGVDTFSIDISSTGVVSMSTARGGLEFGAMPEIGGPTHLHIMRPAGQEGATDLFFGDDYNYVKMPGLYGLGTQGVEIGSSYNSGTVSTWRFGTDGNLTLPSDGYLVVTSGLVSTDASPAPTISGFSITNSVGISGNGNISGGDITATGNVSATSFIGDGSQLTGLPASYSDSDVTTLLGSLGSNSISTTGNIEAGNFIGSGTDVELVAGSSEWTFSSDGNLTLPGNTFAVKYANGTTVSLGGSYGDADVATFLAAFGSNTISTTGNITAGNFVGNGAALTDVTVNVAGNIVGTSSNVTLVAGAYSATMDNTGYFSAPILKSTSSSGNEGGEIQLVKSANATISTGVVIDSYNDRLRIFENGGNARGVYVDLSKAPDGVAGEMLWKTTGFVDAGTYLTLDNIKVSVTTSGNRGLSLGAVSTSFVANIGAWYAVPGGSGGSSANNVTYTTTASNSLFNWQFSTEGDTSTYNIFDKTNNRMYRVTLMIAPSWLNNFICIERLV